MSQSSDKSRKIEQLSTLPSLQDGKSVFNKGSVATKRLRRKLVGITFLCFERGPVSLCTNCHAL